MPKIEKCLVCQSEELIEDAMLIDRTPEIGDERAKIAVNSRPDALIFKGRNTTKTSAVVCKDCGFVHLFAASTEALLEKWF